VQNSLSWLVIAGAAIAAGVRAGRVDAHPDTPRLDDATARVAYLDVTDKEVEERREAAFRFQGSAWSQQDDFHAKEREAIRSFAMSRGVSISSIVSALDRGMRERWPTRSGVLVSQRVIPCRPRLAY